MEKINVAELLKDCPKGMELYSPIYGVGVLAKVTNRIHVKFPKEHNVKCFRLDGKVSEDGEIMLYPKGKTTWEGFVPPSEFKDGDVLYIDCADECGVKQYEYVFILNMIYNNRIHSYCHYRMHNGFYPKATYFSKYPIRLATEEEKQKLFDSIKENGYKWNDETKTLEKLIQPRFKVGDIIRRKNGNDEYIITSINDYTYYYRLNENCTGSLGIQLQEDYELVPNKFDINTLVPFESRVLVRSSYDDIWRPAIYGVINSKKHYHYVIGGHYWIQCIPYEGNQHLLGKTDDCDDYFKTWE